MVHKSTIQQQNGGGGGSGLTVTSVTSASPYTASTTPSVFTIYNTGGAGFTFNLPASPATNQIMVIVDAGVNSGTYAITIQGNGKNIVAYGSGTNSSIQINSNGGSVSLAWDGINWVVYA